MRVVRACLAAMWLWMVCGSAFAAITHVGTTATPADNGALDDSAVRALTPVSGVAAGDLVLVEVVVRNSTESISINATGGQTWTAGTLRSTGSMSARLYYSIFNGSWSGNPSWETGGKFGSALTLIMSVYRPSSGATFSLDVAEASTTTTGTNHTATGQTSTGPAVTLAIFSVADEFRTWALQTAGWTNAGGAQVRNTVGSGTSVSLAYKIQSAAGATGNVTNQISSSNTAIEQVVTFKETAGGGDTQAPTTPSGVTPTVISSSQINLSWTASTDNVAVTGYDVRRCAGASCTPSVSVGTPSGTTFNDTGLTPNTTYRYQVAARDAVPNWSTYSSVVSATTQAATVSITHVGTTSTPADNGALDDSAVRSLTPVSGMAAGDLVLVQVQVRNTTESLSINATGGQTWTAGTQRSTGSMRARLYYCIFNGSWSGNPSWETAGKFGSAFTLIMSVYRPSSGATISLDVAETFATTTGTDHVATGQTSTGPSVTLAIFSVADELRTWALQTAGWTNAGGTQVRNTVGSGTSISLAYKIQSAAGGTGNVTNQISSSNTAAEQVITFKASAGAGDTQAPTTPSGVTPTVISSSQINLSWTASTDNVGVTGYDVRRCAGASCTPSTSVGTPSGTTFNDTGLSASTVYRYQVAARDAVPNWSAYSGLVSATTLASGGDTQAPSAPSGLTPTVISSSQINLSWTASTDNVGVTGYRVERCQGSGCSSFSEVATPSVNSYNDTGRSPSTSYSYRVRATDAVPLFSTYSNTASATTSAASDPPPSAPGTLTATAVSSTRVNLTWGAATDNIGVSAYLIERCPGASCTNFFQVASVTGLSYSDKGLTTAQTYRYRVRAKDTANQNGPYTNIASAAVAPASETTTYTYDAQGRLTNVQITGGGNSGVSQSYGYDDAGNRSSDSTTGAPPP